MIHKSRYITEYFNGDAKPVEQIGNFLRNFSRLKLTKDCGNINSVWGLNNHIAGYGKGCIPLEFWPGSGKASVYTHG